MSEEINSWIRSVDQERAFFALAMFAALITDATTAGRSVDRNSVAIAWNRAVREAESRNTRKAVSP